MEGIGDRMDGGRIDVVYGRCAWDGWGEREEEIGGDGAEGGSGRGGRLCLYTRAGRTGRGCTISKPQCTHTHTPAPMPRPRFQLPPPSTLPPPSPSPPGKIPSLIPNKVSRQLRELGAWELRGRAAQPSIIQSIPPPLRLSSFFFCPLLFLLLVSPETLPCLGSEPVCLFVCLSTLLTCLSSRLVLSCSVLSCASCFTLFSIAHPPNTNLLCPTSFIVTVTITVHCRAS